ncbi:hypothetical protein K439DRAFT_1614071 [Ramaria rubella]|nr:hypothetical protein K439DRAFT_1614071 [Ramaria rubella]
MSCPSTIAHEELDLMHKKMPSNMPSGASGVEGGVDHNKRNHHRAKPPYGKGSTSKSKLIPTGNPKSEGDKESTDKSDSSSESEAESDSKKIPKPIEEPGRPGWGGYNLEEANWDVLRFKKLKKCVHRLIANHLDLTKSFANQSTHLLGIVQAAAVDEFPELKNYSGCWPATDLIKIWLEQKMAAGKYLQK